MGRCYNSELNMRRNGGVKQKALLYQSNRQRGASAVDCKRVLRNAAGCPIRDSRVNNNQCGGLNL